LNESKHFFMSSLFAALRETCIMFPIVMISTGMHQ